MKRLRWVGIVGVIIVITAGVALLFRLTHPYFPFIGEDQSGQAQPPLADMTYSSSGSSCDTITVATTEGPYYITGIEKLQNNNLNYTNLEGTPIKVIGYVYKDTSKTPIQNAKIELWQADTSGNYHPNTNGEATSYNTSEMALRGYITTNSSGYFEFTSIYPGYYEGRARHIHARITAGHFQPVTTQIMFEPEAGDGVTVDDDSIAQSLPPCHLLKMHDEDGVETGAIDFRLNEP